MVLPRSVSIDTVYDSLHGLEQYLDPLAGMLLKGGVLLLAAFALIRCFRKRSARVKHFVWVCAFCMLGALPILQALTPDWMRNPLPLPFKAAVVQRSAVQHSTSLSTFSEPEAMTAATESPISGQMPIDSVFPQTAPSRTFTAPNTVSDGLTATSAMRHKSILSWRAFFVLVWLAGLLLFSCRLVLSYLRLAVWRRRCNADTDGRVEAVASDVRRQLGMKSRPTVLCSTTPCPPMAWGILAPCILIPPVGASWSTDQLRTVLLHEHLHIVRRDPLKLLFVQVVCAVHWCNPLAWFAASRVCEEREQSCDDVALALGLKPCDYARHLVCAARSLPQTAPALAMASPIDLERRVRAVLDEDRERSAPSRKMVAALFVGMLSTMLLLVNVEGHPPTVVPIEKLAPGSRHSPSAQAVGVNSPFEVVNEFIARVRQGRRATSEKTVASWEHVWKLTTRRHGWGADLVELCRSRSLAAAVQIGNPDHMVVLTNAIKETHPEPVVCVFDVVRQGNQWRIDKEEILHQKQAWALVDGFSRGPSVAFVVHPPNIVGSYPMIGSKMQHTFSSDWTYELRSLAPPSGQRRNVAAQGKYADREN